MSTIRQQRKLEKIIVMAQDLLADMQKRSALNGSAAVKTGRNAVADSPNRGRSKEDEV